MIHSLRRFLRICRRVAGAALLGTVCLLPGTVAAEAGGKKNFDIPAGSATTSLKQFAQQSGVELLYSTEAVAGAKTRAVAGQMAPREALSLMLSGSELTMAEGRTNGAIAVTRAPSPNAPRAAPVVTSDRPSPEAASGPIVKLEGVEVTGSRMRLTSGERPVQPVLTLTALDIERTGASSLGQLFQYIPAVTSYSTGFSVETTTGSPTAGGVVGPAQSRTNAQLRGGTESATLLLVDGKRVSRTGQRNGGSVGFDLGGIPLSAIERVEVLLDGASAIYGNDAINGVINVILKKRYAGTEVRLTYDNTFDGDAAVRTASFTHGFARGKWSGLFSVSRTDNTIMLLADRRITASFDRRTYGGIANNSLSATSYIESGAVGAVSGLLPGVGTAVAAIPTGATGQGLTVASFTGLPAPLLVVAPLNQGAMAYLEDFGGSARVGYDFSEQLSLSATARLGRRETKDNGSYRRAAQTSLPAGYPGNPFGVPVVLNKFFYDLPRIYNNYEVSNDEFGLAAKGRLPRDWRYEAAVNYVRGTNDRKPTYLPGAGNKMASVTIVPAALTAAIAAGRTPVLVYDSRTQSPNAPDALDELFVALPGSFTVFSDLAQTWTYAAQADGPLFALPAGLVRAVAGIELREEYIATPNLVTTLVWNPYPKRRVSAAFAEIRVPVIAPKQNWSLVHQLDLNLAARSEGYSDVKAGQVVTPRLGVAWRPTSGLLLRGSYGEGFLAPNLYSTLPVQTATSTTWSAAQTPIDTRRGNENLTGRTYTNFGGGNPDLRPQTSQNWSFGAVLEVPGITGLSLSFDGFDNRYDDRFGTVGTLADRNLYAPETVVRGPNLPGDPAGWPGPVTGIIARTINIATARVAGYNFGVRWNRPTPWGNLTFSSSGERILFNEQRVLPNAEPNASVNKKFNPMRMTSALYWSRGPWDAGVTNIYGGRYWVNTTNAAIAPSRWTDDVMRWDANASYDFGKSRNAREKGGAWWRRALQDTKLSVTVINVANSEPPFDVLGFFSSSVIDSRLRRYILDFTKRF